jgi:hypothetical protein
MSDAILNEETDADCCIKFIKRCVQRQSLSEVKEFVEMQLMHANDVCIKFIDWFD